MTSRYRFLFVLSLVAGTAIWMTILRQQPPATRIENRPDEQEERSGSMQALDFWSRSRAYPYQDISPEKYYKGFEYVRARMKKYPRTPGALNQWKFIGPNNLSGRTISLAINPQDHNTIFAGSASGGLWRSRTGGQAGDWQRMNTGYPVLGVGAIAIAQNDSNVMYIGTGEVYRYGTALGGLVVRTTRGSYGYGILKSTDAGATWTKSLDWTNDQQRGVQSIKINPLNPNTVWAATTEGIYKSTNAGGTWTPVLELLMGEEIIIHPTDTNRVMCSVGNQGVNPAIERTTDGGVNWFDMKPVTFSGKALISPYRANPNDVYASIANYTSDAVANPGALWKSTNFGDSWSAYNNQSDVGVQGWYSHFVAVHPSDSMQVVWANVSLVKSTDGGITFNGGGGGYSDNHTYAIDPADPNILYVGNDDGVYRSTNFGASFSYVSNNLNTGQLYNGFSNSASDSMLALVQSQDHIPGYMYQGSLAWNHGTASDEAGWTAINQTNDSLMYAINRNAGGVRKSTNRGTSWFSSGSFAGFGAWNSPIVISKSTPSVLYAGKDKIFKSVNSGSSWSAANGNALIDGGNPTLSMAVAPTNPDTVLLGTAPYVGSAHIFRSTNGGVSFTDVTGTLPDRYPTDVAIDPHDSRVMYAVFSGFGAGHIFRSTDAGGTWSDITGTLPDVPTQGILVDPLNSNYLYAGNDIGVFISTDGGGTWQSYSEGLPDAVLVADLSYSPSNRVLRCATHGNGAYEIKLPAIFPSVTTTSPNGSETWLAASVHPITWTCDLINRVKLEYSTNGGSSWSLIADSVAANLPGYSWTVPYVNSAAALVRVSSVANPLANDQSNAAFTITFNGMTLSVKNVWNMVSLPLLPPDPTKTSIFPTAVSSAFAYEGNYVTKDTLVPGRGYWVKFGADQDVPVFGDSLAADTIDVVQDWNMVGSISSPIAVNDLTSIPGGIATSEFFGYNGSYFVTDSLRPGKGYWVKTSQSGQIILSSSSASPSNRIRIVHSDELPPAAPSDDMAGLPQRPGAFSLYQNYPNPFNPSTNVSFVIGHSSFVSLKVYDVLGKEVATLHSGNESPGKHEILFDAGSLPSGIYFYTLTAGNTSQTMKMLLLR